MKEDEKALLQDVFSGSQGAFEAFLERYRALIYSVFYGKGFDFPRDYIEDLYQAFVLALTKDDYHKLRAFTGRNNCSLATFLQIVATRFALDELRKWKRHPRGRGMDPDGDTPGFEQPAPEESGPVAVNLEGEQGDIFHNLLFSLDWKRISVVLWVFEGVQRELIAEVMDTSRANIDALYKRAKDQMTQLYAEGNYSRRRREPDDQVLTPAVSEALRELLTVPVERLREALLQPGARQRALVGLILMRYPRFLCSEREMARLGGDPAAIGSVLDELAGRVLP